MIHELSRAELSEYVTEHFRASEFACKCDKYCEGSITREIMPHVRTMASHLECGFRRPLGGAVIVISAIRCKLHNEAVGGAEFSRHLPRYWARGEGAVDIKIGKRDGLELKGWAECQITHGVLPDGGLGTYTRHPQTLHFDTRRSAARWRF